MAVNMRYPSNYAGNDATQNYIRQQQEYIQQLQEQVKSYQKAQEIYSNPIGQYQSQPPQQNTQRTPELTAPTRHAEITQIKDKKEVLDAFVEVGTSRMFMTEDEEMIYVKSVDKDGISAIILLKSDCWRWISYQSRPVTAQMALMVQSPTNLPSGFGLKN